MSASPAHEPRSRRKWSILPVVALCAAAAGGAWWYFRDREPRPEPPAVDLSRVDPDVSRAITSALDDVRAHSRDAARWGRLGMCLRAHDFDMESVEAFRAAARLDPTDYRWPYLEGLSLVLIQPDPGLECLRRAAELAPAYRPEPRLKVAELLFERGDHVGASAIAEAVLKADPSAGRANLLLARIAAVRHDWATALDRATRAGEDPGTKRAAALLRAEVFAGRGEHERARDEFRAAADLRDMPGRVDPVVAEVEKLRVGVAARLDEATRLVDQGRGMEAIALLEETARSSPDNPAPALRLGEMLIMANDPAEARRVLEHFVTRFPNSVDGWFSLGVARFQTEDATHAVEAFRQVVKLKPDHALAHFNLGHCYRKLNDRPAARAAFEETLRCRPDYQPAQDALAELKKDK